MGKDDSNIEMEKKMRENNRTARKRTESEINTGPGKSRY